MSKIVDTGEFPSKLEWKQVIGRAVWEKVESEWQLRLANSDILQGFRVI